MNKNKYYTIYRRESKKDSRGNLLNKWEEKCKVRGTIYVRENKLIKEEKGLIIKEEEMLITKRKEKNKIKKGDKVKDLIVKSILSNGGDLVCILGKEDN